MTPTYQLHVGDALTVLRQLPAESVHCCVTSPPYWGLRDYGVAGQMGMEPTPEEYAARMVEVFREVRRVLREDGTCWVNMGDSYNGYFANQRGTGLETDRQESRPYFDPGTGLRCGGLKPKDLVGIPWRLAFALQADGWWLRSDIIWAKPNPMPESVTDRPTKSHEYLFLLAKSERYFWDQEAVKEASVYPAGYVVTGSLARFGKDEALISANAHRGTTTPVVNGTRNIRSVWTIATAPYKEVHFATFPPDLVKPCVLAGTSARGCCPKCGAPWKRVVEKGEPHGRTENDGKAYKLPKAVLATDTGQNNRALGFVPNRHRDITTTGWVPTCQHGEDPSEVRSPVPCTVLDPFAGSGTTGQVALELGRNAVLIELSPAYAKLIQERLGVVTPGLAI